MKKHFLIFAFLLFMISFHTKAENKAQNNQSISSYQSSTTENSMNTSSSDLSSVTTDTATEAPLESENKGNMNIPIILSIVGLAVILLLFISKRTKKTVSKDELSDNQVFSHPIVADANNENPNEMELLAIATSLYMHIQNEQGGHEIEPNGFYLRQNSTLSPWAAKSFNLRKTPIKIK